MSPLSSSEEGEPTLISMWLINHGEASKHIGKKGGACIPPRPRWPANAASNLPTAVVPPRPPSLLSPTLRHALRVLPSLYLHARDQVTRHAPYLLTKRRHDIGPGNEFLEGGIYGSAWVKSSHGGKSCWLALVISPLYHGIPSGERRVHGLALRCYRGG